MTSLARVDREPGAALEKPQVLITNDQMALVKEVIAKDATDAELGLFIYDCTRRGIHPLDRLLHFTKRKGKYTPVTSIDLFRSRAASTREHMGTDDVVYLGTATVTVYRLVQGEKCPFTATARMSEYLPEPPNDFMWKKMPHGQLGKCAEALALRKGFPQELDGLHTVEEMDQAGDDDRPSRERKQPQRKSDTQKSAGSGRTDHASGAAPKAQVATGLVERVWQPEKKEFYAVKLKDDGRVFTFWVKGGDALQKDLKSFEGTGHRVNLSFTETTKDDRTYQNAVAVAIADAEPATPAAPSATSTQDPPHDTLFGSDAPRDPGQEG